MIDIHRDQIDRYGGDDGLRDPNALLSAVAMPQSGVGGEYFHRDFFEMAAAYLFHIVQNHPFIDGNKRTGLCRCAGVPRTQCHRDRGRQDELAEFVLEIHHDARLPLVRVIECGRRGWLYANELKYDDMARAARAELIAMLEDAGGAP